MCTCVGSVDSVASGVSERWKGSLFCGVRVPWSVGVGRETRVGGDGNSLEVGEKNRLDSWVLVNLRTL